MENNVREFLRKVKSTAIEAGRSAEKTGKNLFDQAKLGAQLAKLNNDVDAQYYAIGKSLYNMHKGEETADEDIDEMLMTLDGLFEQIDETKTRIASYSKSSPVCPNCGKPIKKNYAFCAACGCKLQADAKAKEDHSDDPFKEADIIIEDFEAQEKAETENNSED